MRCYFMRNGHIAGVEVLPEGVSDETAIDMAREFFDLQKDEGRSFEGFEVWHEARHVYRWPAES